MSSNEPPDSSEPDGDGCVNEAQVPDGFPAVGNEGCRTVIEFGIGGTDEPELFVSEFGTRSTSDGGVAFSFSRAGSPSAILLDFVLPSAAMGIYRPRDRASVTYFNLRGYDSEADAGPGDVLIEVVGTNGEAMWGRYLTSICDLDDACLLARGRFASALETDQPAPNDWGRLRRQEFGNRLCERPTDCLASPCQAPRVCIDNRCQDTTPCRGPATGIASWRFSIRGDSLSDPEIAALPVTDGFDERGLRIDTDSCEAVNDCRFYDLRLFSIDLAQELRFRLFSIDGFHLDTYALGAGTSYVLLIDSSGGMRRSDVFGGRGEVTFSADANGNILGQFDARVCADGQPNDCRRLYDGRLEVENWSDNPAMMASPISVPDGVLAVDSFRRTRFSWSSGEAIGPRGVGGSSSLIGIVAERPANAGTFSLTLSTLAPGTYDLSTDFNTRLDLIVPTPDGLIDLYRTTDGAGSITIEGQNGAAVWGRIDATVCRAPNEDCQSFSDMRFTSAL